MSNLTNFGENMLVDFVRGQPMGLASDLSLGLLTAASDSAYTEVSWTGYARKAITRNLANWSGTQADGSITASTGNSHRTSNNTTIDFGTAGAGAGSTISFIGVFSGTNMIAFSPLVNPITVAPGDPVSFAPATIVFTLGLTGGLSDYASNKLIDAIWRGQAFTWPATSYLRLMTTAPTNSGGGVEVAGSGGYASQPLLAALTFWSGTQAAGSTTVSTGTGGRTSNNLAIAFPAPTANWGTLNALAINDAAGAGSNLLFWANLTTARTVNGGGPAPTFAANTLGITFQ